MRIRIQLPKVMGIRIPHSAFFIFLFSSLSTNLLLQRNSHIVEFGKHIAARICVWLSYCNPDGGDETWLQILLASVRCLHHFPLCYCSSPLQVSNVHSNQCSGSRKILGLQDPNSYLILRIRIWFLSSTPKMKKKTWFQQFCDFLMTFEDSCKYTYIK